MDFEQMMDAWKAQDEQPLYGVNRDLLRLVVQSEQADIRRTLRWEKWTTYIFGTAMAAGAGAVLWWFLHHRQPGLGTVAAAVSTSAFVLWILAMWLSQRRQVLRERGFGNTLREEVRRTLSVVDYQLSMVGRWTSLTLWSAPIMVGASLLYWLMAEINDNTPLLYDMAMIAVIVLSIVWTSVETSRKRSRDLLPRKLRLTELLAMIETP